MRLVLPSFLSSFECGLSFLHRIDGPAVEWASGSKEWYRNDLLHRIDGPAWEWADGSKEWYRNGRLHRIDGPAVENADGTKEWYQQGKRFFPRKKG
jgi:hypothetical protein